MKAYLCPMYDRGMEGFLGCMAEFAEFASQKDKERSLEEPLQLPYPVRGDRVGNLSIRLSMVRERCRASDVEGIARVTGDFSIIRQEDRSSMARQVFPCQLFMGSWTARVMLRLEGLSVESLSTSAPAALSSRTSGQQTHSPGLAHAQDGSGPLDPVALDCQKSKQRRCDVGIRCWAQNKEAKWTAALKLMLADLAVLQTWTIEHLERV